MGTSLQNHLVSDSPIKMEPHGVLFQCLGSMGIYTQLEMKSKVQTFGGWQFLTMFTLVYYPFFFLGLYSEFLIRPVSCHAWLL